MKNTMIICIRGLAMLVSLFVALASPPVSAQANTGVADQIPLIQFEDVPLRTAVENLARQAELNYILSAEIPNQVVTRRMENMSARSALTNLLAEHKLFLVENPATSVAHISTNRIKFSVDAKWIAGDTNAAVPLMQFQDVPLDMALANIARQAGLRIDIDPKLTNNSRSPLVRKQLLSDHLVTVRWTNLKFRQAMAALCENYNLVIVEDAVTTGIRITSQ